MSPLERDPPQWSPAEAIAILRYNKISGRGQVTHSPRHTGRGNNACLLGRKRSRALQGEGFGSCSIACPLILDVPAAAAAVGKVPRLQTRRDKRTGTACKILTVYCHPTKMMPCSAGGCPRPAVPCQGQGFGEAVSLSSSPLAVVKPARRCSPSDTHREQTWVPADPHRAPVIYFFNREQQQRVTSGIWKRCMPVQGSLPNLAGGGFAKIPARSCACAPAQPSTAIRIFFPPTDTGWQATCSPRVLA